MNDLKRMIQKSISVRKKLLNFEKSSETSKEKMILKKLNYQMEGVVMAGNEPKVSFMPKKLFEFVEENEYYKTSIKRFLR